MNDTFSLLVVDDEELNRDMLSRRLARRGYDVSVVEDGEKALELIRTRRFDLILLDVMMPRLNGLDVLKLLRNEYSATDLPVIMATAKVQSEEIVEALELGANDYVTKPLDFPVVLARVRTQLDLKRAVEEVRRLEIRLTDRNRQLEVANNRMSRDLRAAARVQSALLPPEVPRKMPGLEFAWTFRPCDELAGDGLGIVPLGGSRVAFYVLDVSGHGVASAFLSVSVTRVLAPPGDPASILVRRIEAADGSTVDEPVSPAEVAGQLDRIFPFDENTEQYFTLIYGLYDSASGELQYVSAGHPGPVLAPANGPSVALEGRGFPIGLADGAPFNECRVALGPGDRIYFYSDGVPEAAALGGEQFGCNRVLEAADRGRSGSLKSAVEALRSDVEDWSGEAGVRDDVTILAMGVDAMDANAGDA